MKIKFYNLPSFLYDFHLIFHFTDNLANNSTKDLENTRTCTERNRTKKKASPRKSTRSTCSGAKKQPHAGFRLVTGSTTLRRFPPNISRFFDSGSATIASASYFHLHQRYTSEDYFEGSRVGDDQGRIARLLPRVAWGRVCLPACAVRLEDVFLDFLFARFSIIEECCLLCFGELGLVFVGVFLNILCFCEKFCLFG